MRRHVFVSLSVLLYLLSPMAIAETVRVAVAANFAATLKPLAARYTDQTGTNVVISSASSGTLYAQILHGAPVDVFLSADRSRPEALIQKQLANADDALIYARGELALWQPNYQGDHFSAQTLLDEQGFIAVANARTAPYGLAAQQTLTGLGLWQALEPRLVRGETISQCWQFVANGSARAGWVAWSHLVAAGHTLDAGVWRVPETLHAPIEQMAVALRGATNPVAAQDFLRFLASESAQAEIQRAGYLSGPAP